MNRLIKAIQAGNFAWERYLNGKTWNGIMLHTTPLFCSYGQIGYTVTVFIGDRQTLSITHDWEMNTTKYEHIKPASGHNWKEDEKDNKILPLCRLL